MIVAETRTDLAKARADLPGRVGVVMTMGALHEGHISLLRAARGAADHVIMTLFVNPLQFGPAEDFDTYPRTRAADLAIADKEGVDLVFAPASDEIYPDGKPGITVDPGPLGEVLEGASRPGFFHGVLTVVLKLLHLTRPHAAFFGEKDYQQLTLIRLMVRDLDLDLDIDITGVPTVREPDGLALSSRNRYLSGEQREPALALSRALAAAAAQRGQGEAAARAAAGSVFAATPGAALDYLSVTDPLLGSPPEHGPARMLVAARVGTTRLIDNAPLTL
jgi:pantoate--beta-alanine ligase